MREVLLELLVGRSGDLAASPVEARACAAARGAGRNRGCKTVARRPEGGTREPHSAHTRGSSMRTLRPQCVSSVAAQFGHTIRRFSRRLSRPSPLMWSRIKAIRRPRQTSPWPQSSHLALLQPFVVEALLQMPAVECRVLDHDLFERRAPGRAGTALRRVGVEMVSGDSPSRGPLSERRGATTAGAHAHPAHALPRTTSSSRWQPSPPTRCISDKEPPLRTHVRVRAGRIISWGARI